MISVDSLMLEGKFYTCLSRILTYRYFTYHKSFDREVVCIEKSASVAIAILNDITSKKKELVDMHHIW